MNESIREPRRLNTLKFYDEPFIVTTTRLLTNMNTYITLTACTINYLYYVYKYV